jgi:hypothetical protein
MLPNEANKKINERMNKRLQACFLQKKLKKEEGRIREK